MEYFQFSSGYGVRLYAGDDLSGGAHLILPEFPKSKKGGASSSPIVLNTIRTSLTISIDKLIQISKLEVVKVNWIEFLRKRIEEEPENKFYFQELQEFIAVKL